MGVQRIEDPAFREKINEIVKNLRKKSNCDTDREHLTSSDESATSASSSKEETEAPSIYSGMSWCSLL